jgi:hypothetical protein
MFKTKVANLPASPLTPNYLKAWANVVDSGVGSWNFMNLVKCCLQWTTVLVGKGKWTRPMQMIDHALDVSIIRKMPGTFWRFRASAQDIAKGKGCKEAVVQTGADAVCDVGIFTLFLSSALLVNLTKRVNLALVGIANFADILSSGIEVKKSICVLVNSSKSGEDKTLARITLVKCIACIAADVLSVLGAIFLGLGLGLLCVSTVQYLFGVLGNGYEQIMQQTLRKEHLLLEKGLA